MLTKLLYNNIINKSSFLGNFFIKKTVPTYVDTDLIILVAAGGLEPSTGRV